MVFSKISNSMLLALVRIVPQAAFFVCNLCSSRSCCAALFVLRQSCACSYVSRSNRLCTAGRACFRAKAFGNLVRCEYCGGRSLQSLPPRLTATRIGAAIKYSPMRCVVQLLANRTFVHSLDIPLSESSLFVSFWETDLCRDSLSSSGILG